MDTFADDTTSSTSHWFSSYHQAEETSQLRRSMYVLKSAAELAVSELSHEDSDRISFDESTVRNSENFEVRQL